MVASCLYAATLAFFLPIPPQPQRRLNIKMADSFVLDRLATIKSTFEELTAKLEDPDIMADVDTLLQVNKDRAKLEPTVEAFETYLSLETQLDEAKEMFNEADDAEMKELATRRSRSARSRWRSSTSGSSCCCCRRTRTTRRT